MLRLQSHEGRFWLTALPALAERARQRFDAAGNYLQDWGGPDHLPRENGLQQWPKQEETIAFDDAVNVTLGLPFVRTSPDHGTAWDIAGRGLADAGSMHAALRTAVEVVKNRRATR